MLKTYKDQYDQDMDELIAAAELIGSRPNYLTVDEQGYYHVQVSGKIEECIGAMEHLLGKLERIKVQRDKIDRK